MYGAGGFISRMIDSLKDNKRPLKRNYIHPKKSFDKENTSLRKLATIPNEMKEKIRRENRRSDIIGAVITIGLLAMLVLSAFILYSSGW
jgi:hypothetical protein